MQPLCNLLLVATIIPALWLVSAVTAPPAVSAQALDVLNSVQEQKVTARGELRLEPARNSYTVGQGINVCYTVPDRGSVVLTDVLPDGSTWDMINEFRDAGSSCVTLWAGPTAGRQCVRLQLRTNLGAGSREICFQVVPRQTI
jgi:hypothetical protein